MCSELEVMDSILDLVKEEDEAMVSPYWVKEEEPEWDVLFDIDLPPSQDELPHWVEEQAEVPNVEACEDSGLSKGCNWGLGGPQEVILGQHLSPALSLGQDSSAQLHDQLMEFEMVLCNTLTPPHSPNSNLLNLIQFSHNELEELLEGNGGESSPSCGGLSPCSSSSTNGDPDWSPDLGSSSGDLDLRSESGRSSSGDPDWSPNPRSESGSVTSGRKRRGGGGAGAVEERKRRKKEQNRDAATRYRLKKKMEAEGIMGEEKELERRNGELKQRLEDLRKETRYLKSLMREMYRAKGLIK